LAIIFIILDRYQTEEGFRTMIKFLDDNLYFNNTKIICATLYIIGVNIKWGSHSLYLNRDTCINGNFIDKTFTIVANILLRIIPTTSGEKEAFTYYRDGAI